MVSFYKEQKVNLSNMLFKHAYIYIAKTKKKTKGMKTQISFQNMIHLWGKMQDDRIGEKEENAKY